MTKTAKKESKEAADYIASKQKPAQEVLKSPTQKLIINVSPVDKNGNDISAHIGKFNIEGTDLYSKTLKLRPIIAVNKLIKMTKTRTKEGADKWNYVNETVFFESYSDTIYDAKGGIACGKVFGKDKKMLSDVEQKSNKEKASSYLYVFGLVQFPEDKEWHFVDFRVGGKRIIELSNAFNRDNIGKNHIISQFIFDLKLKPKSGSVHPDLEVDSDLDHIQDVDDIIDYDAQITEYIEKHNAKIIASFKRYSAQSAEVSNDLNDSLEFGEDE